MVCTTPCSLTHIKGDFFLVVYLLSFPEVECLLFLSIRFFSSVIRRSKSHRSRESGHEGASALDQVELILRYVWLSEVAQQAEGSKWVEYKASKQIS
jgi:hypothetical protein